MLKKCQVFTPQLIAEKMLEIAGYCGDLFGKKVLENSCGDGQILMPIVRHYIEEGFRQNKTPLQIQSGLEDDIVGVEIDKSQAEICKSNLSKVSESFGIKNVNWNIIIGDALKESFPFRFDYIIGNPPYINYREMKKEDRAYLKENFSTCKIGKFDYCYAFIEKSLQLLAVQGKLVYLIPNCIFKNVFAEELRILIKPYLQEIYDYTSKSLFDVKLTSSAIIYLQAGVSNTSYKYYDIVKEKCLTLNKCTLVDKWIFEMERPNEQQQLFSDYFQAQCSVATLCNNAFLLEVKSSDEAFYYLESSEKIEKGIVRVAASPRAKAYGHNKYIIFPYRFSQDNELIKITEEQFQQEFPCAYNYLLGKKETLEKTDKDQSASWYEYGRSQGIRHINQRKILLSTVITHQVNAFMLGANDVPFSGIIITQKGTLPLERALEILQSAEFMTYINSIGVNARSGSKRITPKDINNFKFNL